jgi:Transposase
VSGLSWVIDPSERGSPMNLVSTLGIDLAKSTFSLHGVDAVGAVVLRRTLSRAKLTELVAQLPPCLIGMEACSGAHEWARRFAASGHTVKLMAAKFVTPYRKSGKNDGNDAEAICEAVARPNMRFVPVKSLEQQSDLTLHRVRHVSFNALARPRRLAWASDRSPLRLWSPRSATAVTSKTDGSSPPGWAWYHANTPPVARRGSDTSPSAYLRTLLVMGARAVLQRAASLTDPLSQWALAVRERRGYHRACIAIAAKNARVAWALLAKEPVTA